MTFSTASGNVASMREPLDGSLWWYWIAANAAKKNGASVKITIVLVICSIFVECRSDKVFFVICEIGLKANKSQIIHNFERFVVHEGLLFRVLACARTRRWGSV